ncbi:PerC family transcriptional regulator [Atlantibacter hermannii]|uniref:PerC family transcriptional regulator n=1 Tax=Atlantibacter hermannii TaxID=565 RepID=UPI0028AF94A2|nr:PerC family transcriptional regulator [Atlantibacter hermannii]
MSIASKVLQYVIENPGCNYRDIAKAMPGTNTSTINRCLGRFYEEGKLRRDFQESTLTYYPSNQTMAETLSEEDLRTLTGLENRAQQLEAQGLYFRAASVWLKAFDMAISSTDRNRYVSRRALCLRHAGNFMTPDGRCYLAGRYVGEDK